MKNKIRMLGLAAAVCGAFFGVPGCVFGLAGSGNLFGMDGLVEETETEAPSQAEPVFENVLDDVLLETAEDVATAEMVSDEEAVEIQIELAKQGSLESLKESYKSLGIVNIASGYLNVREKPDNDSKIVGKMVGDDVCDIRDVEGDWYHIVSGPVEGYVAQEYLVEGETADKLAIRAMKNLKVTVDTDTLNVRTEPREDSEILDILDESEKYDVVESLGEWIKIELDNDSAGYVSANYVTLGYRLGQAIEYEEDNQSSLRQQIVNYAMQFIGNPYVWGGESLTRGCDCSGFTMLVYRKFGIYLEHYSVSQASSGRRVTADTMQPGDLIFYARGGSINHVTMYIGNGKCVGAQSHRTGIQVRSWTYRTPVRIVSVLG